MKFHFNKTNTFCISLLSKPSRWSRMEKRFSHFGLNCERFTAITPGDITDIFYHNLMDKPNVCACAQSHINIWRNIVKQNMPYALILEDDAMFDQNWLSKLPTENDIDSNWDLILLNASEPTITHHKWTKANEQYLTGGYIISLAGAEHILKMFDGCYSSADWMTSRLQTRNRSYVYFPWLIIQEGTESTIGSNYQADHEKVIRCLNEAQYSIHNYI